MFLCTWYHVSVPWYMIARVHALSMACIKRGQWRSIVQAALKLWVSSVSLAHAIKSGQTSGQTLFQLHLLYSSGHVSCITNSGQLVLKICDQCSVNAYLTSLKVRRSAFA